MKRKDQSSGTNASGASGDSNNSKLTNMFHKQGSKKPAKEVPVESGSWLDDLREHVHGMWKEQVKCKKPVRRSAAHSFHSRTTGSLPTLGEEPSNDSSPEKPNSPGASVGVRSSLPAMLNRGGSKNLESLAAFHAAENMLDYSSCAALLSELLGLTKEVDGESQYHFAESFFEHACPNSTEIESKKLSFEEFWKVIPDLLLADILSPFLTRCAQRGEDTANDCVFAPTWRWFLVAQNEAQSVINNADAQLASKQKPEVDSEGRLTPFGYSRVLCTCGNSILSTPKPCDLSKPLQQYWIATSHHIYSDAKQQSSISTSSGGGSADSLDALLEPFAHALNACCRCLQIALDPPSGTSVRPSVVSSTDYDVLLQQKRVPLTDMLMFLRDNAFITSPYPLLLCFSVARLNQKMCDSLHALLRRVLGDMLWDAVQGQSLPSPENAKNRIIVGLAPFQEMDPDPDPALCVEELSGKDVAHVTPDDARFTKDFAWRGIWLDLSLPNPPPKEELLHFLSSDVLLQLPRSKRKTLVEYHRRQLALVYPLTIRKCPMNFNVAAAWASGVHMAAVSFSRNDDHAVLTHLGRFAAHNGGTGYVLKPPFLRGENTGAQSAPQKFELTVLAARAIAREDGSFPENAVLTAATWGAAEDCRSFKLRASSARKGPILLWPAGQTVTFPVTNPSLAVLSLEVSELDPVLGKSKILACFAAPVDELRPGNPVGLRWVHLWAGGKSGTAPCVYGEMCGILVSLKRELWRPDRSID